MKILLVTGLALATLFVGCTTNAPTAASTNAVVVAANNATQAQNAVNTTITAAIVAVSVAHDAFITAAALSPKLASEQALADQAYSDFQTVAAEVQKASDAYFKTAGAAGTQAGALAAMAAVAPDIKLAAAQYRATIALLK